MGHIPVSGKAVQAKSPIWSSKRLKERARSIFISVLPRCRRHGAIEEEINGEWQTSIEGTTDYYHVLVALNGKNHFRLVGISEKKSYLKLNEVFVFSDGELPDWVQQWEPTPKKADLLLLVAHPDDELIFFGGTIPTYAVEKNMNVVGRVHELFQYDAPQ